VMRRTHTAVHNRRLSRCGNSLTATGSSVAVRN
jgi:hypothetical protein